MKHMFSKHIFYPVFKDLDEVRKHGWNLDDDTCVQTYLDKVQTLQEMFEFAKDIDTTAKTKQDHKNLAAQLVYAMDRLNSMYKYVLLWAENPIKEYSMAVDFDYNKTTKLDLDIRLMRGKYLICRDILASMKVCKEIANLSEKYYIFPISAEIEMEKYFRQVEEDFYKLIS